MSRLEIRFLVAAAAAAILPLIGVWLIGWRLVGEAYLGQASQHLAGMTERIAAELEARLVTIDRVLKTVCVLAGDNPELALDVALAELPELDTVGLADGRGYVRASRFRVVPPGNRLPKAEPGSVRKDEWGEPLLRVVERCGQRRLEADVRLRPIFDLVATVPPNDTARLFDRSGRLLASSDLTEVLSQGVRAPASEVRRSTRRLASGWRLSVETSRAALTAPLGRANWLMALALVLALFASAVPGVRLARSLTRPLSLLSQGAAALGQSKKPPQLPVTGPPEARAAIRAFNRMAEDLAEHAERLEALVNERTQALRLALRQAEAASRAKSRFLASVSHELRTPLTSIKGYASTLRSRDVRWSEAETEAFLKVIEEEADRLSRLVNDLLDFARHEAQGLRLVTEPLDVSALIETLQPRLRKLAPEHPVRFSIAPGVPRVPADRERIAGVLYNLVENAGRHTPPGTEITVEALPHPEGVEIVVRDQGPGIPPPLWEAVFEPFFQGEPKPHGSGLGLAICKLVVEAHGGRIWIDTPDGGGTAVHLILPKEAHAGPDRG